MRCLVNYEYENIAELKKLGLTVIPLYANSSLIGSTAAHCDMNVCSIGDRLFIANEQRQLCSLFDRYTLLNKRLGCDYPSDCALNCVQIEGYLLCNEKTVNSEILSYAIKIGLQPLFVRQGYCACSTLVCGNNCAVTADTGIANALSVAGIKVLLIKSGGIALKGYDYGFIGGASMRLLNGDIAFFGNIESHPSFAEMDSFFEQNNLSYHCLSGKLTDIGSALIF